MEYICITHLTDKRNIGKFKNEHEKNKSENKLFKSYLESLDEQLRILD
jgi:hypothetical protein